MCLDVIGEHLDALLRLQVNHLDAVFAKPIDAAAEVGRFTHNDRADVKLPHQSAAIPARRERGYHDLVSITALASRLAKRVGLAMSGRIAFLHAAIVAAPQQFAVLDE